MKEILIKTFEDIYVLSIKTQIDIRAYIVKICIQKTQQQ